MKYVVRESLVWVLGYIWMPNTLATMTYTLTDHDVDVARGDDGNITRESVSRWVDTHAGDFQSVIDFRASIEDGDNTVDIEWESEDNELTYSDIMHGWEDA